MKKKMYKLVTILSLFITPLAVLTASCGDDSDTIIIKNDNSYTTDIGGGGEFMAINTNTSDTVKMSGAITLGQSPILQSHNGDKIKLCFIPADKYKNYHFTTTFTLHDSTEVKDNYEYEYMLKDVETGLYQLNLAAIYKDDNNNISSGGSFKLNVKE
jgi:hypothetical protein